MAESRRIFALAWPIILTHMNWSLMSLIDVMIVGRVSTEELAALGAGRIVNWIFIVTGMSALTGILVYASQADGAGELRRTGAIFRQGVALSLLLALPGLLIMLALPAPLLAVIGVAPELVHPGAKVVQAYALGLPGLFLLCAASFFLEGISRPHRVMVVNLLILPLNALLDWLLAGGNWGFPAWGAVGAAIATAISVTVGAALILLAIRALPRATERGIGSKDAIQPGGLWPGIVKLARFGVMPAISAGLELAGFAYLIVLSTQLGLVPTAAFQVVMAFHTITFALALGFSSAAGVRVGNAVGEGQRQLALPRSLIASAIAIAVMAVPITLMLLAPQWLAAGFSEQPSVVMLAATLIFALAPFIVFDGLQAVGVAALRSLEDQVVAGINGIIAYLLVLAGSAWWFVAAGFGTMGLVHALQVSMVVATLLHFGRLIWLSRRSY